MLTRHVSSHVSTDFCSILKTVIEINCRVVISLLGVFASWNYGRVEFSSIKLFAAPIFRPLKFLPFTQKFTMHPDTSYPQ